MAKEIVNRQVNIFISSGDAQKAFDALIKKEKLLNAELAKTTDPKKMKELASDIAKLQEPISRAAKKVSGELNPSLKDTTATVTRLRNELSRLSDGDADFKKVTEQYRQGSKELETQRQKVGMISKAWKSFWQEAKTVAAGVIIGNTIQSALQTVLGYITGVVTGSAKISDELADIQRVTGLTSQEVKTLNSELKKIDTRTSASALREIVVIAGKLGIAKGDILGFTTAVDKLNVALGGELGDINTFTTDLGKILNVFEGKITGDNVTKLGNAIVDLANKGVASGPFLVDFAQRLSGIAKTSNLSLSSLLGLGAGLEETGQRVESSSTAISKLLVTIATDIPKAAKIAGVETKKFADIFAKAPEEGLLLFAQGLQKDKGSFAEIASSFKDAGEEGARVISTLSTLGQKTDFFREKITDAGVAINNTTQIQAAFALKNNNAGAALDKFRKNVASIFTSRTFQEGGEAAIRIMNGFVNVLKGIPEFVRENRFALLTLAAGILVLNGAYIKAGASAVFFRTMQLAELVVSKLVTVAMGIQRAALIAYDVIVLAVTRRISAATAAQTLWKVAMSAGAGPIGVLLVTVGALAIGLGKLFSRTKELTAAQKIQADVAAKVNEATGTTVAQIEALTKVAADENVQLDNRKKAIAALIQINPAFADTLKINAQGHLDGTTAIKDYIAALQKKAEAEAKYSLLVDKTKQKNEVFSGLRQEFGVPNFTDAQLEAEIRKQASKGTNLFSGVNDLATKERAKRMTGLLEEINILQKDIATTSIEAITQVKETVTKTDEIIKDDVKNTGAAVKDTLTDLLKDLQKIKDDLRLSQLSPLDRELAELDIKFTALRDRAGKNEKLNIIITQLHQESRLRLIQEYAKREVEVWKKAGEDINKKADEQFRKNIEALHSLTATISEEYRKQLLKEESADANKRFNEFDRNRMAGLELELLKAKGKKRLDAELALLKEQERQELEQKDLTENEKLLIEEKYRRKRQEAELDYFRNIISKVQEYGDMLLNELSFWDNIKTTKENNELARDKSLNDAKKANLDRRLKGGLISQLQYNKEVEKLDREQSQKERRIAKDQFERNKKMEAASAFLSGQNAVLKAMEIFGPPLLPNIPGIIAFALTEGLAIAKTAAILKQKAPVFAQGGKIDGRSHADGGNAIIDGHGRKIAEIEKEEGIINKFSMRDRNRYTVSGTPSQISSAVNGLHGGRTWDSGARLRPVWSTRQPVPMNFTDIKKYYAAGGKFNNTVAAQSDTSIQADPLLLHMMDKLETTLARIEANGITAYTLVSQNEKAQARMDAIRADATMVK